MMTIIIMLHDVPTIERVEKMLHNRLSSLLALVGGNSTSSHTQKRMKGAAKKCKWYEEEIHKWPKNIFNCINTFFTLHIRQHTTKCAVLCHNRYNWVSKVLNILLIFQVLHTIFHPSRFFFRVLKPLLYVQKSSGTALGGSLIAFKACHFSSSLPSR